MVTILKIPKLQVYFVLAVVVRDLSQAQCASCLIVAFLLKGWHRRVVTPQ